MTAAAELPVRSTTSGTRRLRHQLSVYSPVALPALLRAAYETGARGDRRGELADTIAAEYRADRVVLLGSGTQALQLALEVALPDRASAAPVALPAFCCYDVASAAVGAGRPVVLYDLDLTTLGPRLDSLEEAFRAGAGAAVIAPLYGFPVDWSALEELARRYGATLVEDAAQGHGARWRRARLGTLGDISVLSFGRGKGWTGGSGGALLLRGDAAKADVGQVAPPSAEARGLLVTAAQWGLGRPALYALPMAIPALGLGETHYRPPQPPAVISRAAASLLLELRTAAAAEAAGRTERAGRLLGALRDAPGLAFIEPVDGARPGYLRLPVRLRGGLEALPEPGLAARLGIAASYPSTLDQVGALAPLLPRVRPGYPGAEQLVHELVTLPVHSLLSAADEAAIVDLLRSA